MLMFGNSPGTVGTAVSEGALPFALIVGGGNLVPALPTPAVIKAAITGFRGSDRSAVGLAPTLRDRLYVWLFGEKPGTASITGYAFPDLCGDGTQTLPWTGLDAAYSYFEIARANTLGLPVRLVFGPHTVRYGFLEEFDHDLADASTGVSMIQFKFKMIPRSQISGTVTAPLWG